MSVALALIDRLTAVILEGVVRTGHRGDFKEAQDKVKEFLLQNLERLTAWAETHPGQRPPILFNDQTGEVIWLTRAQSRKMKRRLVKVAARA